MIGLGEGIVIGLILLAVIMFGKNSKKIARDLGESVGQFKAGLKTIPEELQKEAKEIKEEVKK